MLELTKPTNFSQTSHTTIQFTQKSPLKNRIEREKMIGGVMIDGIRLSWCGVAKENEK
jgi:hypothetical protein